jgi:hypothetical protein
VAGWGPAFARCVRPAVHLITAVTPGVGWSALALGRRLPSRGQREPRDASPILSSPSGGEASATSSISSSIGDDERVTDVDLLGFLAGTTHVQRVAERLTGRHERRDLRAG